MILIKEFKTVNSFLVKLKINKLKELLQEPSLLFADVAVVPKEDVTTGYLDINIAGLFF